MGFFSKNKKELTAQLSLKWHFIPYEECMVELGTSEKGLTSEQAKERILKFGPNRPPEVKPRHPVIIFLNQFISPLIFVLIAAAILSALVKDIKDALFIGATLLVNACIGAWQEMKAEKSAKALRDLVQIKARVLRDGMAVEIPAAEIVPGDVVLLESGARVPSDMRLFSINNLTIDESLLTGESLPDVKVTEVMPENSRVVDMNNMAFAGTVVMTGRGMGVVTGTGQYTELGKIAATMKESKAGKSPLIQRMEKFSAQVSIITLLACGVVAAILLSRGHGTIEVLFAAIALAVSAIPEGLPLALTIAMSAASSRMAKRNVLVRSITAVESLGSCTMIASDKTGTLTVNQQTIKKVILRKGKTLEITGEGYKGEGSINGDKDDADFKELVFNSCICNEAEMKFKEGKWEATGDSMDMGFLALAFKAGIDPNQARASVKIIEHIPYESEKKYSGAVYEKNGVKYKCYKGALEAIVGLCGKCGESEFNEIADKMAAEGFRVLAVAYGPEKESGLKILGIACFMDPLRPESVHAVKVCREAGIEVAMLTGDHPATAAYIGAQLGIIKEGQQAVTGRDLENLSPEKFEEKAAESRLFARLTPVQKLNVISAFMKKGHFVAVTGDGANDAPALKKANIGVAMGSGTDIAKDTSSMIITDDNFSSIVAGIEEGRVAYDNIRKVIYMLLSTGLTAIVLFIMAIAEDTAIPLVAIQLLWLNMVTSGLQAASLAFEKKEEGVMQRKPRPPGQGIFDKLMVSELFIAGIYMGMCAYWVWMHFLPTGVDNARNMALLFLVLAQNFQVINSKSETKSVFKMKFFDNPMLLIVIIAAQTIHITSMHIPFMQDLLKINSVQFWDWFNTMLLAASVIPVMEVYKLFLRKILNQGTADNDDKKN